MQRLLLLATIGAMTFSIGGPRADGRGFGGFRGFSGSSSFGGFSHSSSFSGERSGSFGRSGFDSFEGSRSSSFGGSRSSSYGGWNRGSSYEGSRSGNYAAGGGRAAGERSYDRSYTGSRGGSYNASGERGFAAGPRGVAAGGSRDVNATGPGGRSYSSSEQRGAAVGPYGRYVGGSRGSATASGPHGTASSNWQSAFAGHGHMPTDFGLAHYSTVNAASFKHGTYYRSAADINGQGVFVRNSFGYYNAFRPAWYSAHPGCWYPRVGRRHTHGRPRPGQSLLPGAACQPHRSITTMATPWSSMTIRST